MSIGSLDIPATELRKAQEAVTNKYRQAVCAVLPRARFHIRESGKIEFTTLICSSADMGGKATGVGAEVCANCNNR